MLYNAVMKRIKKALCIIVGFFCMLFGLLGAFFFGIAQGDVHGKVVGILVGLLVALFGWWLTRLIEKKFSKVLEILFEILFLSWP